MSEGKETKFHDNGTVTYWSAFQQCWVRKTNIVPESELVGMPDDEREKILKHIEANWTEG